MQPNRLRLDQIAEYTSIAASILGIFISTASRQIVYAAAPLSVSLFLNLLNRQRFEEQTQRSLTATAARVERQLAQIEQAFSHLQQDVANELNSQFHTIDGRLTSSQQAQANFFTTLSQLEQRVSQLTTEVASEIQTLRQLLQSQAAVVNPATLQDIQQGLSGMQNRLRAFESLNLGLLPQNLSQLQASFEERFSQLQQSVATLRQEIESQEPTIDPAALERVQQELTQLKSQIALIESFNIRSVLQSITQLQAQQDSLLQSISSIDQHLENLPSTVRVDSLQTQVERLQASLNQLQGNWQQQQDNLQAAIDQLEQQLQDLIAGWSPPPPPPDEEELLYINLGIDFGTSFTKVCFRDIGRNYSEVVTFADRSANLEEALLPTKIGVLEDGTLLAGLTAAEWAALEQPLKTSINYIKMRLADLDIPQQSDRWRLDRLPELDRPETVENLCAYYLSCAIARAQSWIRQNKPDLVKNQTIEWSANVGVPVEYCDSAAIARFQKVLSLAWLLRNEPQIELFTLETLDKCLSELRSHLADNPIDCHAIPEISAEVWSCLNSREFDDGFYVFFDVGCGTLDGVSFRYWRHDGEPKVDFYSGLVKPLGVSAISQSLAAELNLPEGRVKRLIFNSKNSRSNQFNATQSRRQIQQLVGKVVVEGRENHGNHRPVFKDLAVQPGLSVFIGGGGGLTSFYKKAILDTHVNFQHRNVGIPAYIQKNIPTPKDLSLNGLNPVEFHRFAVAYGLSIPKDEGAEFRLPSEMAKAEPQALPNYGSEPNRYEDSKDSC
ncbi:MAG TPA: hypothetical protein DDZ80_23035 [Cyanobacteria bacterium UBA8803]|nr:hypothetical protein [Cyanobacteria bacterium UBA9273]HBL61201.1 hypothetical protein [Cyanobacteria bacterium UBA8803]